MVLIILVQCVCAYGILCLHMCHAVQLDQDEELLHFPGKQGTSKRDAFEQYCSEDDRSGPSLSMSDTESESTKRVFNTESQCGNDTVIRKQVEDGTSGIQPGDAASDLSEVNGKHGVL